jgi:hypothetical protein
MKGNISVVITEIETSHDDEFEDEKRGSDSRKLLGDGGDAGLGLR